jgi:hypothetical protein
MLQIAKQILIFVYMNTFLLVHINVKLLLEIYNYNINVMHIGQTYPN